MSNRIFGVNFSFAYQFSELLQEALGKNYEVCKTVFLEEVELFAILIINKNTSRISNITFLNLEPDNKEDYIEEIKKEINWTPITKCLCGLKYSEIGYPNGCPIG